MVLEQFRNRRSIRAFTDEPVPEALIDDIIEAGRLAPSAANLQHLRVMRVTAEADRQAIASAAYGIGALASAQAMLVCMANLSAAELLGERIAELQEVGALEPLDLSVLESGAGRPFELELGEDVALVDTGIGMAHLELQAASAGLGTCWAHHVDTQQIADHFDVPANLRIVAVLALGWPAEDPAPRPRIRSIEWTPSKTYRD